MAQGDVTCNLTNALPKRCAVFDGVDDYVEVADDDSLDFGTGDFSVSAWFKTSDGINQMDIISRVGNTGAQHVFFEVNRSVQNGKLTITIRDADSDKADVVSQNSVADNKWHYLTVVWNDSANNVKFYLDNALEGQDTNANVDTVFNDGNILIGSLTPTQRFFNGSIDEVRIYNKALTQSEITKLYQGGNVTDGLVSRWKFDKDYKDSVGSNDGTNHGSYLTTVDDQVSKAISDARVTANDKYLMAVVNNKIMTSVIEEA